MALPKKTIPQIEQKRAAIYVRVSTQYQVDRASLPVQRSELVNYAKYALDIPDFVIFEDAGYSAKNTDRPDYQQMMARIRTGEFSHLLVWKIDRISRNLLDFAAMYSELKQLGVVFVSKNEQFDTSSAMGEAMLKIILVFAELERNMTAERVSAVFLSRANDGIWNGGKVPFGYAYDKQTKTFSILEDEAKTVRLIYALYESSKSLVTVSKALNERGIKTRNGSEWSPTTVHTMLSNPFYSGTYRYNYRNESDPHHHVPKKKEDWILVKNHHPAIVSPEHQAAVELILASKSYGKNQTYQRKNIHAFAGLLTCGYCGSTMAATIDRARADGWRPSVYICSRRRMSNDCQNKYVSDVTLGPFVLNFFANLIKASNSFGKSTSIETLEKKLLRGDALSIVDHIERPGLEELYNHLRSGFDEKPFDSLAVNAAEASSDVQERDLLLADKRRLERALKRLNAIYLYGDEEIPGKDFILDRKSITDSLQQIDDRLKELDAAAVFDVSLSDDEFMEKASQFILTQQLLDKRSVNYEKFIRKIDPRIVKDFLNETVSNFCIKDGLTTSVLFKNGIELRFCYKAQQ
jgi:DNA invertase Pin-like site-specific DNA recombinase|nr:MAG TPA: integrase [Caudoviricetes sp.]